MVSEANKYLQDMCGISEQEAEILLDGYAEDIRKTR
jgi:hypothetical protein